MKMDDVGRRIDFLADLQDAWGQAYQFATNNTWHSKREQEQGKELGIALRLLEDYMADGFVINTYARVINTLPKPEDE